MDRIELLSGCSISSPTVYPDNWKTDKASLKDKWYVQFYFYDPSNRPYKKLNIISKGINKYKTLLERRQAAQALIDTVIALVKDEGYNYITGEFSEVKRDPIDSDWVLSLEDVVKKLEVQPHTKECIDNAVRNIKAASARLKLDLNITEVSRKHILSCLVNIRENNPRFGPPSYNRHIGYLKSVFDKLIEMQVIEDNPVLGIKKLPEVPKVRDLISDEEIEILRNKLPGQCYSLWRYINIFFHSGGRSTELFKVKKSDIYINRQQYKCTVLKGSFKKEIWRPIVQDALPFWIELYDSANENDYIISADLEPGPLQESTDILQSKWKYHVQKILGIKKTFYQFKHLHSTRLSELKGDQAAADFNQHKSMDMVKKVYNINYSDQALEKAKKLNVKF